MIVEVSPNQGYPWLLEDWLIIFVCPTGSFPYDGNHPNKKVVQNLCPTEADVTNDSSWALEGIYVSLKSFARVIIDDILALDFLPVG